MKVKKNFTTTTNSALAALETKEIVDGLGRTIQNIKVKYSSNNKDVIVGVQYDNKGRVIKEYQPIESTGNLGAFFPVPIATPHTLTTYEPSPLNRPASTTPPSWAYPTTYSYGANAATDVMNVATGSNYA